MKRFIVFFLFLSVSFLSFAQTKLSGTILDKNTNTPIIGASVIVKGTTIGTVSDFDGNFTMVVEKEKPTLTISFIGYKTQELVVGSESSITVLMDEDVEGLDEVIVVGYGTQKKSHLTGSISKVKNEGLAEIPVARADEALLGKTSGMTIQMTDYTPGASPDIRIRGIGSISADAGPLVVVDGIVDEDGLSSIDMNDVESVEVLKDAASTAIYGSRGGNGVIMITTKSGQAGKARFTFNASRGVKFTANYDNPVPTVEEWSDYVRSINDGELSDRMVYANEIGTQTNWIDEMFDGGIYENYNLSVSGGSEKTTYNISLGYMNDEGVLLTDYYKKINARVKLKTKFSDRLTAGININPSYTEKRDFPIGIHDALRFQTWLPIQHNEHTIQFVDRGNYPNVQVGDYARDSHFKNYDLYGDGGKYSVYCTSNQNPYAKVMEREYMTYTYKVNTSFDLKYKLAKGLHFKTQVAANVNYGLRERWVGTEAHRNGASASENDVRHQLNTHLVNESYFTLDRSIGDHDFNAVAGTSFETRNIKQHQSVGTIYQFDYIQTLNAASEYALDADNTYHANYALHSLFGRMNYAYAGKYLASFSARYDGSSIFGEDTRYGFFPAVSAGWRVSEEDFMKDIDAVSNLKLRASFGYSGTDKLGYNTKRDDWYAAISLIEPVSAITNGTTSTGFNPSTMANPDLQWEMQEEKTFGFDLGLMDGRVSMSADYYHRKSKDLLLQMPVAAVTGFETSITNIGEMVNEGLELELNLDILRDKDFKWNISANGSFNRNELTDFAGIDKKIGFWDSKRAAEFYTAVGLPLSNFYGYVYEKDVPVEYMKDPTYSMGITSQDAYVKDLNGDGEIDTDDRTVLGNPYPDFTWGLTNNFSYKNLDFSFVLQGSHGAEVRIMDAQYLENQFSSSADYNSEFPDGDKVVQKYFTSDYVQDASFIALRSINLGYTLPSHVVNRIGMKSARVFVSGQNLIYLMADGYEGYNPEGITEDDDATMHGYQRGATPVTKAVTVGLNIGF